MDHRVASRHVAEHKLCHGDNLEENKLWGNMNGTLADRFSSVMALDECESSGICDHGGS